MKTSLVLLFLPFSGLYAQHSTVITKYKCYEAGYDYFNFDKSKGAQRVTLGYFLMYRKSAEKPIKKYTALGPSFNLDLYFKGNSTRLGGSVGFTAAFQRIEANQEYLPTLDSRFLYINKDDYRLSLAVGVTSFIFKVTGGINYQLSNQQEGTRFYPEIGVRVQLPSYQDPIWGL